MTSPACQRLAGGHQSRDREAFVLGLNNNTCLVVRFSKWEITLIYHDIPHLSVYTYIYISMECSQLYRVLYGLKL